MHSVLRRVFTASALPQQLLSNLLLLLPWGHHAATALCLFAVSTEEPGAGHKAGDHQADQNQEQEQPLK